MPENSQKEKKMQYRKEKTDQLNIDIPKGNKRLLKEYAEANGISMADLIVAAVKRMYGIDLREKHSFENDSDRDKLDE